MSNALTSAWQRALAAEQQAAFGYGLAGAHLDTDALSQLAHTCQSAHEGLRDSAAAAITAAGSTPNPPAADYPSLYPVSDARGARQLAIRIETDTARAWRFLYAVAADATGARPAARAAAQAALTASAVRATRWRLLVDPTAATVAFPGI